MAPSAPRSLGPTLLLLAALVLAVLLGLRLAPHLGGEEEPTRVLLVVQVSGAPGDLSATQGRAISTLVKDLLETRGRRAVTLDAEAPAADAPLREGELLILRPTRTGAQMGLQANVAHLPGALAPRILTCPAQEPAKALEWLLGQLPGPQGVKDSGGHLLPTDPQAFWDLVEGMALQVEGHPTEALLRAERAQARAPECATVALLQGELRYTLALDAARPTAQDLDQAQQGFEEALRRWPHLPRAGMGLVRLYSDTGHARGALEVARDLHHSYPKRAGTASAVLYASRFAGLMDVVDKGTTELEGITVDPAKPQRMQLGELYLGQWSAFEKSLWIRPGDAYNAMVRFHLGYLRLLQGRREDARTVFVELERLSEGHPKYVRLGRVFRLALEHRTDQARRELLPLDEESTGLAVPDGEFTFNLAEAWAFLGDQGAAVEAASRALGQGFACTRWYEQSPLLRDLQSLPRWRALLQTLHQRQQRLEALFPPEAFG